MIAETIGTVLLAKGTAFVRLFVAQALLAQMIYFGLATGAGNACATHKVNQQQYLRS